MLLTSSGMPYSIHAVGHLIAERIPHRAAPPSLTNDRWAAPRVSRSIQSQTPHATTSRSSSRWAVWEINYDLGCPLEDVSKWSCEVCVFGGKLADGRGLTATQLSMQFKWSGKATSGGKGLLTFACRDETGKSSMGAMAAPLAAPTSSTQPT